MPHRQPPLALLAEACGWAVQMFLCLHGTRMSLFPLFMTNGTSHVFGSGWTIFHMLFSSQQWKICLFNSKTDRLATTVWKGFWWRMICLPEVAGTPLPFKYFLAYSLWIKLNTQWIKHFFAQLSRISWKFLKVEILGWSIDIDSWCGSHSAPWQTSYHLAEKIISSSFIPSTP